MFEIGKKVLFRQIMLVGEAEIVGRWRNYYLVQESYTERGHKLKEVNCYREDFLVAADSPEAASLRLLAAKWHQLDKEMSQCDIDINAIFEAAHKKKPKKMQKPATAPWLTPSGVTLYSNASSLLMNIDPQPGETHAG